MKAFVAIAFLAVAMADPTKYITKDIYGRTTVLDDGMPDVYNPSVIVPSVRSAYYPATVQQTQELFRQQQENVRKVNEYNRQILDQAKIQKDQEMIRQQAAQQYNLQEQINKQQIAKNMQEQKQNQMVMLKNLDMQKQQQQQQLIAQKMQQEQQKKMNEQQAVLSYIQPNPLYTSIVKREAEPFVNYYGLPLTSYYGSVSPFTGYNTGYTNAGIFRGLYKREAESDPEPASVRLYASSLYPNGFYPSTVAATRTVIPATRTVIPATRTVIPSTRTVIPATNAFLNYPFNTFGYTTL